jgi:hypothetical protein
MVWIILLGLLKHKPAVYNYTRGSLKNEGDPYEPLRMLSE